MGQTCFICEREGADGFSYVPPTPVTFPGGVEVVVGDWHCCTDINACNERAIAQYLPRVTAAEFRREIETMGDDAP